MELHLSILIFVVLQLTIEAVPEKTAVDYCSVRQAKFSYNFDFSELTNKNEAYIIKHAEYNYLKLQLCKPLKNGCNGINDTAICHYNGNRQFVIGKEPPIVQVQFGQTIFKYIGEKCTNERNYTVNIRMICDFTAKEPNKIEWFPDDDKDCDYNLQWRTTVACVERQQIKCSLDHKTGHYDLSSLINYSNNYEVFVSNKHLVVLNVCHSVLYRPNSCHSNNAACLVSSDNPNDSKNLGIPTEDLRYNPVNKSLTLTYTNGAICTARNVSANHIKTTITFYCDLNSMNTLPHYVGGEEECNYQFRWVTVAACSEEVLKKKSLEQSASENCSVRNPLNNNMINLSSLSHRQFMVNRFGTEEWYKFSICSPLSNTSCAPGSGVCQVSRNISGGVFNTNLLWKESGPYLNYTNGGLCGTMNQRTSTIIEFYCDEIESSEIEETGNSCYNKIKISTNLTCERPTQLCVTYNKQINLEPLKLELSNYVIKSQNLEYHINICNSLVQEDGLNCPNGTAICKYTYKRGKVTYPISLGYPSDNLIANSDRSAVLIYKNGSICEEDKNRRIESSISFLCDLNNRNGMPNLTFYKDCTYFFEWKTELVCGYITGKYHEENCSISNSLGDVRDLSFLQESLGPRYITADNGKSYNISLISGHEYCKKGFICSDDFNYGTDANVFFDYSANSIRIHFTQGTKCQEETYAKSSITLICSEEALSTRPSVVKEEPCNIEFEWHTSNICRRQNHEPAGSKMKDSTDLQKGETNMNHHALDNRTKEDNPESQGESKIIKSTGIGGGVIVSITVMIALVVAVAIYIVKRRNAFYTICPTFFLIIW